jgi:hypothetical protein
MRRDACQVIMRGVKTGHDEKRERATGGFGALLDRTSTSQRLDNSKFEPWQPIEAMAGVAQFA